MHPHRSSALGYASAASALHSRRYGACSAEAAASEAFGLFWMRMRVLSLKQKQSGVKLTDIKCLVLFLLIKWIKSAQTSLIVWI